MSVEVVGLVSEAFESGFDDGAFALRGEGRLRLLSVGFGDEWLTQRPLEESVGSVVEHEAGVLAHVRVSGGRRLRLDIVLESVVDDVLTVPGPVLHVEGEREPISWHAGASAEILLPSADGPGVLTQRRGLSAPGEGPVLSHPLGEEVTLAPRQVVSAAWTYEAYPGGLLDAPGEQSWLPLVRYVPIGDYIQVVAPDGTVTVEGEERNLLDDDGEFEVPPPEGLGHVVVWNASGATRVEIGGYRRIEELREALAATSGSSDVWAYVATRHLLDGPLREELLDRVDWVLGTHAESPTAWSVSAAQLAVMLGLPAPRLDEAAAEVLAGGRPDDAILLALHGLAPEVLAGGWPVGDLITAGVDAVARLSYGRPHTDGRPERGRDVAVAKLLAAVLGEREEGLHVAAYARSAEARLLCQLTTRPDPVDIAWLSVNAG
ncbi:MAG: hypothetical protein IPJ61_07280 [Tessaracoccus sp.]|uniref:hypothetical protein n=1 Tax=Tessaracoccus sp. TaxID=1971211 RepID=UPI001EC0CA1A|nr:hypothetical protein [Tessaracoccus sp.]MBK7820873.1 hypothetical protein [Tessaracoccus sp.]